MGNSPTSTSEIRKGYSDDLLAGTSRSGEAGGGTGLMMWHEFLCSFSKVGRIRIGRCIPGAGILHGEPDALVRVLRDDGYIQRLQLRVQTMLDGVFHDRLERQGRDAEKRVRRVKLHEQPSLKTRLFHREIRPRVLQLLREGDRALLRNGGEVALQIPGKIQNDLLRFLGILGAEEIDAHERIVDEMGTHLQNGNLSPLPHGLVLLFQITPNNIGNQIQLHKNDLDRDRSEEADQKHDLLHPFQFLAPSDQSDKADDRGHRDQQDAQDRHEADSEIAARHGVDFSADLTQNSGYLDRRNQYTLGEHDRALSVVLSAAVEEIGKYQQGRERDDYGIDEKKRLIERRGKRIYGFRQYFKHRVGHRQGQNGDI